jgi:hypothetical protein
MQHDDLRWISRVQSRVVAVARSDLQSIRADADPASSFVDTSAERESVKNEKTAWFQLQTKKFADSVVTQLTRASDVHAGFVGSGPIVVGSARRTALCVLCVLCGEISLFHHWTKLMRGEARVSG